MASSRRRRERGLQREAAGDPEERLAGVLRDAGTLATSAGSTISSNGWASGASPSAIGPGGSGCLPRVASCCWACKAAARAFAPRRSPDSGSCPCCVSTSAGCSVAWSVRVKRTSAVQSRTAESVAPVILWIDEIDKALAGSAGSAGSDGGTSARVFGTFLTWLSEKTARSLSLPQRTTSAIFPPNCSAKGGLTRSFSSTCRPTRNVRKFCGSI